MDFASSGDNLISAFLSELAKASITLGGIVILSIPEISKQESAVLKDAAYKIKITNILFYYGSRNKIKIEI